MNVNLSYELSLISEQTKSLGVYYSLKANYHTNVRIIIKIPDTMLHKLYIAGDKQKCSRAAIIREAISAFLDSNNHQTNLSPFLEYGRTRKRTDSIIRDTFRNPTVFSSPTLS